MKETYAIDIQRIFIKIFPEFAQFPIGHRLRKLYAEILVYMEES